MKLITILTTLLLSLSLYFAHAENEDVSVTINLEIADGQGGSLLPENEEETPGAFTVANLNDTDGDVIVDNADNDVTDEIDLMQLKMNAPTNTDLEESCTLTLPANAKLYKSSDKKAGVETKRSWKVKELPQTRWVELQAASSSVRAEEFKWNGAGKSDTCKATGVWVKKTGFKNKIADLLWSDCDDPCKKTFTNGIKKFGKTFQPEPGKVHYSCGFEFESSPSGLSNESKVKFDVTRQKYTRIWVETLGAWQSLPSGKHDFPFASDMSKVEEANDENPSPSQDDNDNIPDKNNHLYSIDGPGVKNDAFFNKIVFKANFNEFVRVKFDGAQPTGSKSGTSCSVKQKWHMFMGIKDKADEFSYEIDSSRTNEVDEDHVTIDNENANEP